MRMLCLYFLIALLLLSPQINLSTPVSAKDSKKESCEKCKKAPHQTCTFEYNKGKNSCEETRIKCRSKCPIEPEKMQDCAGRCDNQFDICMKIVQKAKRDCIEKECSEDCKKE